MLERGDKVVNVSKVAYANSCFLSLNKTAASLSSTISGVHTNHANANAIVVRLSYLGNCCSNYVNGNEC